VQLDPLDVGVAHGIQGIADQVDDHLLQPIGIAPHQGLAFFAPVDQLHPILLDARHEQQQGVVDSLGHVGGHRCGRGLPGKAFQ